jgi:hypothetical protein
MDQSERDRLVKQYADQYLWEMRLQKLAKRNRNRTSLQYIKDRLEDMRNGMIRNGILQEVQDEVKRRREAGEDKPQYRPSRTYEPHGVSKKVIREKYEEAKAQGLYVARYGRLEGEICISAFTTHPRRGGEYLWTFPEERMR